MGQPPIAIPYEGFVDGAVALLKVEVGGSWRARSARKPVGNQKRIAD